MITLSFSQLSKPFRHLLHIIRFPSQTHKSQSPPPVWSPAVICRNNVPPVLVSSGQFDNIFDPVMDIDNRIQQIQFRSIIAERPGRSHLDLHKTHGYSIFGFPFPGRFDVNNRQNQFRIHSMTTSFHSDNGLPLEKPWRYRDWFQQAPDQA